MHPDLVNTIYRHRMTTLVNEAKAYRWARPITARRSRKAAGG